MATFLYLDGNYHTIAYGGGTNDWKLHWCDVDSNGFTVLKQSNVLYYNKEYNWVAFG